MSCDNNIDIQIRKRKKRINESVNARLGTASA
jgi:hypothetical protein